MTTSTKRNRFQKGTFVREGGLVYHRFTDQRPTGETFKAKILIGTVKQYPSDQLAELSPVVIANLRRINGDQPQVVSVAVTVNVLSATFLKDYASKLSPGYFKACASYVRKWIDPRWGNLVATAIHPPEVKKWFEMIELAPKSKNNIKWCLKEMWDQGVLNGLIPHGTPNVWESIEIKDASKRQSVPDLLSVTEFQYILAAAEREDDHLTHAAIALAAATGARISEVLGVRWSDVDFKKKAINIDTGWTGGELTDLKTEASKAKVPLADAVADILTAWRKETPYGKDTDYVFASVRERGKQPVWSDSLREDHLHPAVERGIAQMVFDGNTELAEQLAAKNVGWHTFRHTHKKWHDDLGTPLAVQQKLMRHADPRTTQAVYGVDTEVSDAQRTANSKVVEFAMKKQKVQKQRA